MKIRHTKALLSVMTVAVLAGGFATAAPSASAAANHAVVASPDGAGEACEEAAPCSLATAKLQARAVAEAGEAVDVLLRGGRYNLSEPLLFTADDSGAEQAPVTFKAFGAEEPILTSGVSLAGWEDAGDGVYSTSTAGLDFRQLYVDGVRATPARYPNVGSNVQLQASDRTAKTLTVLSSQFAAFGASDLTQIDVVAQLQWGETYARIASASESAPGAIGALTTIALQPEEADILFQRPYPLLSNGSPMHFENSRAFLDSPGEFFVDRVAERVFYMPRPGEDLSSAFEVPVLDTLIDVKGTPEGPVHDLRFEGLTFEYTGWNRPTHHGYLNAQGGLYNISASMQNKQYVDRPPAALQASYSDRITITGSTFRKIGSTALDLNTAVHDSTVIGNVVSDVSGNGIMVGKFSDPDVEYHVPYQPTDLNEVTARVTISNNVITRTGQVYLGTAGINGGYIRDTSIVHNDISDSPLAGISTGWGWTREKTAQENNRISFNRIANVVNQLCDGAGIYHLSNDPGTIFEGNYMHDIVRPPTACGSPVAGFYLDEGTNNTIVRNNVLADVDGQLSFNANGPDNTIAGNAAAGKSVIQKAGLEPEHRHLLARINLAAGKATSSSSEYDGRFRSAAAVDGDLGTGWSPASADSAPWWQVDLGESMPLAQVSLTMRQDTDQVETRRNFEIRGSDDPTFASYTVLSKRNSSAVADAGTYTSAVRDTGTYRYLRVVKTDGSYFFFTEFSAQAGNGVVAPHAVPEFDQSTPWTLTNVNSGLLAEIAGKSTADGGDLSQATPNSQTNQQWYLRPAGGNLFSIVNVNSGKALDNYASYRKGDRVHQWTVNGQSNQLWTIERYGDDYVIRSAHSRQVLDVGGNSTQTGAAVGQWMDVTQTNQLWTIAPVNPVVITPSSSPAANAAGWHNSAVDLTFSTAAEGVAIESRVVGTESWLSTEPVRIGTEGSTKVDYRGLRGESVAVGSSGQVEVKLDSVAPISSAATEPASGTVVAGQTVTARFTAADSTSGVAEIVYSVDDGATWSAAGVEGVSFTSLGAHVVLYRSTDNAGNAEAEKSITVTVAPPRDVAQASITSTDEPTADGWYQQGVLVKLTAPSAGQKIQYRVNEGGWKAYSSSVSISANGTSTINHRLVVSNVVVSGSDAQLQVKIDKSAPTVKAERTPAGGKGTPRNPISVSFSGTDLLSGLDRVEYMLNSGLWTTATSDTVAIDAVGDYVISYRAKDKAGNVSATKSLAVTIATDAPASIKVGATAVKPVAAVTLTLSGFTRWDDVIVSLNGAPLAVVMTDQNGSAKITVRIPAGAPAGQAVVLASGREGTMTAKATITVKK